VDGIKDIAIVKNNRLRRAMARMCYRYVSGAWIPTKIDFATDIDWSAVPDILEDTLVHEYCHAARCLMNPKTYKNEQAHGREWKELMIECGAKATATCLDDRIVKMRYPDAPGVPERPPIPDTPPGRGRSMPPVEPVKYRTYELAEYDRTFWFGSKGKVIVSTKTAGHIPDPIPTKVGKALWAKLRPPEEWEGPRTKKPPAPKPAPKPPRRPKAKKPPAPKPPAPAPKPPAPKPKPTPANGYGGWTDAKLLSELERLTVVLEKGGLTPAEDENVSRQWDQVVAELNRRGME
jgi:hypothetical protein